VKFATSALGQERETNHAEVVFNPNAMNQKMVTDFGYPEHVDSEKR
jgi:hypothetical protein